MVAAGSDDGSVSLWDIATGKLIARDSSDGYVIELTKASGNLLAVDWPAIGAHGPFSPVNGEVIAGSTGRVSLRIRRTTSHSPASVRCGAEPRRGIYLGRRRRHSTDSTGRHERRVPGLVRADNDRLAIRHSYPVRAVLVRGLTERARGHLPATSFLSPQRSTTHAMPAETRPRWRMPPRPGWPGPNHSPPLPITRPPPVLTPDNLWLLTPRRALEGWSSYPCSLNFGRGTDGSHIRQIHVPGGYRKLVKHSGALGVAAVNADLGSTTEMS